MATSLERATPAPLLRPGETVVLLDGTCKLCNRWARFLIYHDTAHRVRLATVQSPEGQTLLAWAGMPLDQFDTMTVIRGHHYWVRSDGFFEVIAMLPGIWRALGLLRLCPKVIRDRIYDWIARNRYRLFGQYDHSSLPAPDHERRFLASTAARP